MNTHSFGRVIKIVALLALASVVLRALLAAAQLAAVHFGWEAVALFVVGWLAAGSGKVALTVLVPHRGRRTVGQLLAFGFAKNLAALFALAVTAVAVAQVFHPSAAAGVPLLIGGAFAAVTIFPTRTVARMLVPVA